MAEEVGLRVVLPGDLRQLPRRTKRPTLTKPSWAGCVVQALIGSNPKKLDIVERADRKIVANPSIWSVAILYPHDFRELRLSVGFANDKAFAKSLDTTESCKFFAGRSGASFSKTCDGMLVIKEVGEEDYNALVDIGPDYFDHVATGQTCMAKIVAAFKVTVNCESRTYHLIVSEAVSAWAGAKVINKYDLKGVVRRFRPDSFSDVTLKQPLLLTKNSHRRFFSVLERDLSFLADIGRVDYSLLVFQTDDGSLVVGLIDYLGYLWPDCIRTLKHLAVLLKYNCRKEVAVLHPSRYSRRMLKSFHKYFPACN